MALPASLLHLILIHCCRLLIRLVLHIVRTPLWQHVLHHPWSRSFDPILVVWFISHPSMISWALMILEPQYMIVIALECITSWSSCVYSVFSHQMRIVNEECDITANALAKLESYHPMSCCFSLPMCHVLTIKRISCSDIIQVCCCIRSLSMMLWQRQPVADLPNETRKGSCCCKLL